ncbi:hypothetical protein BH10ACT7_BH10ACT7_05690 [soil metagenome]
MLLAIAFACAIGMRFALLPHFTSDYTYGMSAWLETLRTEGFSAFGRHFSDYNVPYLYLLYLGSLLPLEPLAIVKLIGAISDLALALGAAAIVLRLGKGRMVAGFVGIATLFIPEVFLNSAMWGQVDSLYTAFMLWSIWAVLTRRDIAAWVLFAIAVDVKLQAIFLMPFMALAFVVQRQRWRVFLYALIPIVLLALPTLIAGRSLRSLAGVYFYQAGASLGLALDVANPYQWVPNELYDVVSKAGMFFGVAVVALLLVLWLRHRSPARDTEVWLLHVATAVMTVVPFILPQMHDRYFFPAGILAAICAVQDRRFLVPAVIMQFTAVVAYAPVLFFIPPFLSYQVLGLIQLVPVCWIVWLSFAPERDRMLPYFAPRTL